MSVHKKASLYVDGASRGNPGPSSIGAYLCDDQGHEIKSVSQTIGQTTNNVAEYRALIEGCKLARSQEITELHIFSDSQLLVRQVLGQYKVKQPHLKLLWQEAKDILASFEVFSLDHVPREENQKADALANQALDMDS
ncbi:MAG: ribonuclease HI family protein [Bdellovibrionales bacterium]|nr:ribonuclease HI family protein [Bdellovibrionales bacterium]